MWKRSSVTSIPGILNLLRIKRGLIKLWPQLSHSMSTSPVRAKLLCRDGGQDPRADNRSTGGPRRSPAYAVTA